MVHERELELENRIEALFMTAYGRANVDRQHTFSTGWRADLFIDCGAVALTVEIESRASAVRPGVAQALCYASHRPEYVPMVVTADDHLPADDRLEILRGLCDVVTESELRDRLDVDRAAIDEFCA